jgi:lipopolysaccharide heptosyltransferase II
VSSRLWGRARRTADAAAWGLFGGLGLASHLVGRQVPPLDPASVRRILVIRLDLLGDLVFAAPTIAALRAAYPTAELTLLTLPYTRPLAALIPGVDRTLALDVNRYRRPDGWWHLGEAIALVRGLRAARFDLCLALHGRPAGVLALLSGTRYRVGYAAHAYPFAFNVPVPGRRYDRRQHETRYCLDLARAVGADGPAVPRLLTPSAAFPVPGLTPGERYVVVHPGASNGSAKRWSAAAWAQLARDAPHALGVRVVLSGGESERALVAAVAAGAGDAAVPLVGTSLLDLAALLAGAEALVSGDTGPLHLAAALGRPVLGVYGPTDPGQTGPLGGRAAVVRRPVPCGPCYDLREPAECKLPDRTHVCLRELAPDAVLGALLRLLRHPEGVPSESRVPLPTSGR